ncbi:uncharacterized protein LOC126851850 [Cataglyphis hispanica]|uniref:uncharacterized protein LOC126851850 n=1 Tax=Cataglyphis hispanica TaxID=1086592 RepID=UPI00217F22FC|nr:uncharacterized protein LOC126851850 [Cataglyphis hispanica]
MLPGIPSILYRDEIGIEDCECQDHKALAHVHNLVPMYWEKKNSPGSSFSPLGITTWLLEARKPMETSLIGTVEEMTRLRAETTFIYVKAVLREGQIKVNCDVRNQKYAGTSQKDLDNLRDHIMFPAEKIAVLHTIARGFTGQTFQSDTVSLQDLLDENSLNKIYSNTLTKIWDGFTTFGAATAGVFGIFIIIRIIKIVFDTLIHGYALHAAYGCSLHLLGAIWSSFTHLLLYLANRPQTDTNTPTTPKETCDQNTETNAPSNEPQEIPIVYTFRDLRARLDE